MLKKFVEKKFKNFLSELEFLLSPPKQSKQFLLQPLFKVDVLYDQRIRLGREKKEIESLFD